MTGWPSPPRKDRRTIACGDCTVCIPCVEMGTGPTVILVHGWLHSADRWIATMRALAGDFHLVAMDLPGFGSAPGLPEAMLSLRTYADILDAFVRQAAPAGQGAPSIVGHSMGGILALLLAERRREAFANVVLVGVPTEGLHGPLGVLRYPAVVRGLLRAAHRLPPAIARPLIARIALLTVRRLDDVDDLIVQDILRADAPSASLLIGETARFCLDRIDPALEPARVSMIRGQHDLVASRRAARNAGRRFGWRCIEVPGSGHTVMTENSQAFARALRGLLLGTGEGAAG